MQQDNNIENKLRQQEAMEQPDLSQMDTHWQQMQAVLQPGSIPMKKGWPKWMLNTLSVAAVVVLIGAAMWYLSSKENNTNEVIVKQKESAPKENLNTVSITPSTDDTITKETVEPIVLNVNPSLIYDSVGQGNGEAKAWTEEDSILGTVKLNVIPCITCPDKKDEAFLSNIERQLRLTNLFIQLEKKEQHFNIDNSRDTLLQFEEGTVLLVPANSFGGMNGIELTAKEFYNTSDIILNQLNTASNKEQLETGGMIHLTATQNRTPVNIDSSKALKLYMSDTGSNINGMQLFSGINSDAHNQVNWLPKKQYFSKTGTFTEARVLNMVNMPYKLKETNKGVIAYFLSDDSITLSKDSIKQLLKEKYGYYKVKLRSAEWWAMHGRWWETTGYFDSYYASMIGDSVWMENELADKYKLAYTATRVVPGNGRYKWYKHYWDSTTTIGNGTYKLIPGFSAILNNKYGVDITDLGWINCDRFYKDKRTKIQYAINLEDSSINYSTMLVFDRIKSIINGFATGNKVVFNDIPVGEPVKVISIGINKKGETVYSVTPTTTSEEELKGLQFQSTSAPDLKASLSKLDK